MLRRHIPTRLIPTPGKLVIEIHRHAVVRDRNGDRALVAGGPADGKEEESELFDAVPVDSDGSLGGGDDAFGPCYVAGDGLDSVGSEAGASGCYA